MKSIVTFFFLYISINLVSAQNSTKFDLYDYNLKVINPAFVGIKRGQSFNTIINTRDNIDGSSILYDYEQRLPKSNRIGFIHSHTNVYFSIMQYNYDVLYNRRIAIGREKNLNLGISTKYQLNSFDKSSYHNGQIIELFTNESNIGGSLGISYQQKNFLVGAAIKTLLFKEDSLLTQWTIHSGNNGYNIYASKKINLHPKIVLIPSFFFESEKGSHATHINLNATIFDVIITGVMYNNYFNINNNYFTYLFGLNVIKKIKLLSMFRIEKVEPTPISVVGNDPTNFNNPYSTITHEKTHSISVEIGLQFNIN